MKLTKFIPSLFLSILAGAALLTGCSKSPRSAESAKNEVVVYTYDSFISEWGPGPVIKDKFEKSTGLTLTFIDCGDGVDALNKAILEKKNPFCDVVLGIDNNLYESASKENFMESYIPADGEKLIDKSLVDALGGKWELTPFDHSHFAIIWDSESSIPAPESLEDLTGEIYRKKIILMDPRTSTPGLGFAAWTKAVFGDQALDFWKSLKPNILTMTDGWSSGWSMFTKGEAPLVISYTTSPAYCIEYEDTDRFKTLVFNQGHVQQVEGACIMKNAANKDGAKKFIDFLISEAAQNEIPLTQWMYPANKNIQMPECYTKGAPVPEKTLTVKEIPDDFISQIIEVLESK